MLKRYNIAIDNNRALDGSERGESVGYSADSALKMIEQAFRDGATRVFVWENGKGMFSDNPWRE